MTTPRRQLLTLTLVGPLLGALMVAGVGNPTQPLLWFVACAAAASALVDRPRRIWIAEALLLTLAWGTLHDVIESLWADAYLANNPSLVGRLSNPAWMPARYWVLLTGPVAGLAMGGALVAAVAAWRALRLRTAARA